MLFNEEDGLNKLEEIISSSDCTEGLLRFKNYKNPEEYQEQQLKH